MRTPLYEKLAGAIVLGVLGSVVGFIALANLQSHTPAAVASKNEIIRADGTRDSLPAAQTLPLTEAEANLGWNEYLTANDTVICANPFKLDEAVEAVHNPAWLAETGCSTLPVGLKVTRLTYDTGETWQVRVQALNVTGWVHSEFDTRGLAWKGPHVSAQPAKSTPVKTYTVPKAQPDTSVEAILKSVKALKPVPPVQN